MEALISALKFSHLSADAKENLKRAVQSEGLEKRPKIWLLSVKWHRVGVKLEGCPKE